MADAGCISSRARQKAAARQQRLALEAAQRRAAHRRRAVVTLVAVTVAALSVVATVVGLSRGGADEPARAAPQPAATHALFAGLEQDGIALGSPTAPATLIEFADLQCPFCGVYARDVLPSVVERYVRSGRLRLESHVLTFLGEDSVRAGRMAAAAALQDRLWDFTDAFYARQGEENSGYVTDAFLADAGTAAGVDLGAARRAQGGSAATKLLEDSRAAAERLGIEGTPAFYVRRGDGTPRPLAVSELTAEAFAAELDAALAQR
jgi:protein-disulfide isomerase